MWPSFPGWNAFPMTDDKFGFHSLLLATSSIICFQGGGGSGFEKVARIIRKFRVKTGSTCHSGGATWLQAILTPFPDKDKLSYATTCLGSQLRRSFLYSSERRRPMQPEFLTVKLGKKLRTKYCSQAQQDSIKITQASVSRKKLTKSPGHNQFSFSSKRFF